MSYTVLAAVSLSVTALFPVLFFFAPESPHYLIAKGKTKEAYSSLLWLRTNITEEGIHKEITDIEVNSLLIFENRNSLSLWNKFFFQILMDF